MELNVRFSKHALKQARKRGLWKYVNKKKFYYDARYFSPTKSVLDDVVYCHVVDEDSVVITTMYRKDLRLDNILVYS